MKPFFNYSYTKFVLNFQFEKSLNIIISIIIIIIIIISIINIISINVIIIITLS